MATVQTSILAERWLDEVLLAGARSDVGADAVDEYVLPAGFGDCAIMSILIQVASEATPVSSVELGASARIRDAAPGTTDIVGTGKWLKVSATGHECHIDVDALTLWRQGESCQLKYPELDSNGVPTDDHTAFFKVVRVHPIQASEQPRPLRLVR